MLDLLNHLVYSPPCPRCRDRIDVSLGQVRRGEAILCPMCKNRVSFSLAEDHLSALAEAATALEGTLAEQGFRLRWKP